MLTLEVPNMSKVLNKGHVRAVLRVLSRIALAIAAIMIIDAVVLGVFLYSQRGLQYATFMESVILLMLLEGSLIVAAGGVLFFSSKEDMVTEQKITNPTVAQEQQQKSRRKGMSRHQWAVLIMVAGLLLIFIGFLTSAMTQI